MDDQCKCGGERWICEEHPELPWPHDDCPGPGMPCHCNPNAELNPGFTVIMTAKDGYAH